MNATTHQQHILLSLPPTMPLEALRAVLRPLNLALVYRPDPRPATAQRRIRAAVAGGAL
jgi:hypothetical protein